MYREVFVSVMKVTHTDDIYCCTVVPYVTLEYIHLHLYLYSQRVTHKALHNIETGKKKREILQAVLSR